MSKSYTIRVKWVSPCAQTGWERDDITYYEFLGNGALLYRTAEEPTVTKVTKEYDTIRIQPNQKEEQCQET